MTETAKFETWAIVEVMGHRQFAGFVTEQALGGASFVRVDVPAVTAADGEQLPSFTKLLSQAAIYAISPCTEETARAFAAQSRQRSFAAYEAPRLPAPFPEPDRTMPCGHTPEDCDCDPLDDDDEDWDDEVERETAMDPADLI